MIDKILMRSAILVAMAFMISLVIGIVWLFYFDEGPCDCPRCIELEAKVTEWTNK